MIREQILEAVANRGSVSCRYWCLSQVLRAIVPL
jgi:hypothetical protein